MSEPIELETLHRILARLGKGDDVCGKYTGRVLRLPLGELTPMERLCLVTLTDEAREGQDVVWLSTRQVAARMGTKSKDTAERTLKALRSRGLARAQRGRNGTSGWRLPSWVTAETSRKSAPTSGATVENSIVDNSGAPTIGAPRPDHRGSSAPTTGASSVPEVERSGPSRPQRSETFSPDPTASLAALRSPDGSAPLARPGLSPNGIGAATPTAAPEERDRLARARQRELKAQLAQMQCRTAPDPL